MNGQISNLGRPAVSSLCALPRAGRRDGWGRGAKSMIRGTNTDHRTAHGMAWQGMA